MVLHLIVLLKNMLIRVFWQGNTFEKIAKIAIPILVILHFSILTISPPGFYIDEAATGSHVVSMLKNQTDANGQSWPLFSSSLGGGYTTPTYLYPVTVWSMIFGDSEYALRAFSQFATIIAIFFIGLSIYLWFDKKAMLIAWRVGLTLPWAWLQGSLAWDPALVPLFVSLWFFGFSLIEKRTKYKLWGLAILGVSLVCLAYTYPPTRIVAPILLGSSLIYLIGERKINIKEFIITCLVSLVLVMPLAIFMFQPDALIRSQQLNTFHGISFFDGMTATINNFIDLFNPIYLFIDSGYNLRHGVGAQGMLGFAALIAILYLFISKTGRHEIFNNKKPYKKLLLISILGISLSYISSALTSEGQPHYLRACAAWPFYVIVITIGWLMILSLKSKIKYMYIALATFCIILFIYNFAFIYPTKSKEYFDFTKRQEFNSGQTNTYPDIVKRYYQR